MLRVKHSSTTMIYRFITLFDENRFFRTMD